MEAAGAICEGGWSFSSNEMLSYEADFMAQLLGNCSLPNASAFWGGDESEEKEFGVESSSVYPSFSLGYCSEGGYSCYPFVNNSSLMVTDFCNDSIGSDEKLPCPMPGDEMSCKKRCHVLGETRRSKKIKKCDGNENDDSNVVLHRQSSSSFCSEDDSVNGVQSSSSSKRGKARASRGSATDPQSLYARKRRERINERLKILQNLVPNGTKVDISTMLEEAVQYVKFLQLQIKLLSSDDMWMYAPLAYNWMDIGLDFKIPSPKPQP